MNSCASSSFLLSGEYGVVTCCHAAAKVDQVLGFLCSAPITGKEGSYREVLALMCVSQIFAGK